MQRVWWEASKQGKKQNLTEQEVTLLGQKKQQVYGRSSYVIRSNCPFIHTSTKSDTELLIGFLSAASLVARPVGKQRHSSKVGENDVFRLVKNFHFLLQEWYFWPSWTWNVSVCVCVCVCYFYHTGQHVSSQQKKKQENNIFVILLLFVFENSSQFSTHPAWFFSKKNKNTTSISSMIPSAPEEAPIWHWMCLLFIRFVRSLANEEEVLRSSTSGCVQVQAYERRKLISGLFKLHGKWKHIKINTLNCKFR